MSDSSSPIKIVFLDRATIPPSTRLKELPFPHELLVFEKTAANEVADRIRSADIVITNKVKLSKEDLAGAASLKLIAIAATGTDNVDLAVCAERKIAVCNVRNYATHTVPEHTFALIFALRRSLAAYRDAVRAGRWAESGQFCFFDFPIRDLAGSTIGIVGDGALGTATANIARALGLRVLFSAYKGRTDMGPLYTPFEEVLQESDIITLHCPLTGSTRNLIADAEFALMKRKPILVNTARGGLVDEQALVRALKSNQISGAGFDVVTEEPLRRDHPFATILDHPGFILTPHVAWASEEAIQTLADQLVDNVAAFVQGTPRNIVARTA
ncbi:Glycerate dehydrogenase [Paraburkholderia piptadeniae]|uniref:Glycerate dehydrogenase n=1 Tax=Paraburkholderia piptadeniae TaxID=1701573 RepID=A0A1N7SPJ3_9BURK|nr:D-2-hydroxyacid dehydrogenase [Paraburkholderia piptadeniae]SIT49345.1 Glycerate dehydrogenase [Paraburkholderia piptadeniae]